jgi:23S rRNA (pseudouridine1915-N3)-methyltransferase
MKAGPLISQPPPHMNWSIITVGKPALPWAREALADYAARLKKTQQVELIHLKDGPPEVVTKRMLEASHNSLRVLLDERGRQYRSTELAKWVQQQELHGCKRVSLLIGGANGHSAELKAAVKDSWSLSNMTLQHEIALIVLLEQIYRAYTILRGEPYHRE